MRKTQATNILITSLLLFSLPVAASAYELTDTGQEECFDDVQVIPTPEPGDDYYGQDGNYQGTVPACIDGGDGTVPFVISPL